MPSSQDPDQHPSQASPESSPQTPSQAPHGYPPQQYPSPQYPQGQNPQEYSPPQGQFPPGPPSQGMPPQGPPPQGYPPQGPPPQFAPQQTEPGPSQPKLLAVFSLVAGIIGLLAVLFPWVAIGAGVVAVVLGVLALVWKHVKGLAIAGTIVGGFAVILGIGALILFSIAEAKINAPPPPSAPGIEETEEPGQPSLFEQLRAEADLDEFTEVDAARLGTIVADPEAHQEELIVIYGNMGEPLVHPGLEEQQMCLMQFAAYTDPAAEPGEEIDALLLDEYVDFECPIVNQFLGLNGEGLSVESLRGMHKLYVVPTQSMPTEADGDLPAFLIVHAEAVDAP